MADELAIETVKLSCSYGNSPVLQDVSLCVRPGRICGLLGPNGSGKTTFFRCCLNFLKATGGAVYMNGHPTLALAPAKLAKTVAYVPQEHALPFSFPVKDIVLMGRNPHLRSLSRPLKKDEEAAEAALARIGILHLAHQPCNQLSGGQRQLTLIARAVAQQTPLIFLDEPTSALDFENQLEIWKTLRDLAGQNITIIACCHDPNHILWFCDQVALLENGHILDAGAPSRVITKDALDCLYHGSCIRGELADGLPVVYPAFPACHSRNFSESTTDLPNGNKSEIAQCGDHCPC